MNPPWCGACRAMLAIVTTSFMLALPVVVRAAEEENPPAAALNDAAPAQTEDIRVKPAEERVAELEARVEKLERELHRLRAAAQSAAAALASAAGSSENPGTASHGVGRVSAGHTASVGGGSVSPVRGTASQQSAARERNDFLLLSDESKKEFLAEMRAMVARMPNATPEERSDAVREILERLRAKDEAKKSTGGGSDAGNGINISNAAEALPKMPEVSKPEAPTQAPPASAERAGGSEDATRRRFEALSAAQRERFINEMRNMREKMQYATPEERSAMVKELLTKVEKETAKPSTAPAAPLQTPPPAATPREPEKVK